MPLPRLPSSRRTTLAKKYRLSKLFDSAEPSTPHSFATAESCTAKSCTAKSSPPQSLAPQSLRHRKVSLRIVFGPQTFFADLPQTFSAVPQTFLSQAGWPRPARQQPVACCARSAANDISDCEAPEGTVGGCAPRKEPCPSNNLTACNLLDLI